MASTRHICTITWKIIGNGTSDDILNEKNTCSQFIILTGSRKTCDNCRLRTHEGSERYNDFVREHPGIVPAREPDPVKPQVVFDHHKYVVTESGKDMRGIGNLRKPAVEMLNRIESDPNFDPMGKRQKQIIENLLDSTLIYDTSTMIPAEQLTYDRTIALFNANPEKRQHFMKCHDKTPEDFFSKPEHNKPEHFQHFLLTFKIEVKP